MKLFLILLSSFICTVSSNTYCFDSFSYGICQTLLTTGLCKTDNSIKNCRKTCGHCIVKRIKKSTCRDIKKDCQYWRYFRYCEPNNYYHNFMKANCPKTCQFCKTVTKTTATTTTTTSDSSCSDSFPKDNCNRFLAKGLCNNENSKQNCRKTCGHCTTEKSTCKDKRKKTDCQYWKNKSFCNSTSEWYDFMKVNCKKTCQFCGTKKEASSTTTTAATTKSTTTLTTTKAKKCMDSSHYEKKCSQWKSYCRKPTLKRPNEYYDFMRQHCKSTCSFCAVKKTDGKKKDGCGVDGLAKVSKLFVVGGRNAIKHKWRWQVGLYSYGQFFCGGSLVTPRHVVTAAHCLKSRLIEGLTVVAGDYERNKADGPEQETAVGKAVIHEDYDTVTFDNDIGIITLKRPFELNKVIGTICLPESENMPKEVRTCYITGWGRGVGYGETKLVLQEAEMPIIDSKECGKRNVDSSGKSSITSNMLCAGFPDKLVSGCQGDSGGPFVCKGKTGNWVLEGAVSWGSQACDASHRYTVFAKVRNYISWIKKQIG